MKNKTYLVAFAVLALAIFAGCHGDTDPTVPVGLKNPTVAANPSGNSNTAVWGIWDCTVDPYTGAVEIVPLRQAELTVNVTKHIEGKPGNLLISEMDTTGLFGDGSLDCTVTLKHPFPGVDMYNGFDVWGVFMHNGESEFGYDGLTYGGGPDAGEEEAVLTNPDGFTRWYNYSEFSGSGVPLFTFVSGKLADLPNPTATMNAYKVFADGLGKTDNYYDWITSGDNAADRGIFKAGGSNSRRYELKFPLVGGVPKVHFQYAVIASWEQGDPILTGSPSVYDPGDFPPNANCEEAFLLKTSTDNSDLYNDGAGASGGSFKADIEVFDWQGGAAGGTGVPNEVNSIIIMGDFVPGGSHEFTQPELAAVAVPATENSSVFQVEIANCTPPAATESEFRMVVEAAGANGDSYDQGYPTPIPTGSRRASFMFGSVGISDIAPWPDVVYVDDSNTTGIEDGSHQHPWNTIQEGVDNDPDVKGIWVDDSGNTYIESVQMQDATNLKSVNWDDSDGTGRAKIRAANGEGINAVNFIDVTDAIIEGFEINPNGVDTVSFFTVNMVVVTNGSDNTIKDCRFTGKIIDSAIEYVLFLSPVVATGCTNLTIQNCSFDNLDRDLNPDTMYGWYIIQASGCPNFNILNNVFANIRATPDNNDKIGYITYIDTCNDMEIKNNVIYNVKPDANSNGAILQEGFHIESCTNPSFINNTVDSMDVTGGFFIQQVFAYRMDSCTGMIFKNNMATSIYSNGFPPPLARGVLAVNCTFTAYCCDMWDIGPGGNGQNYYSSGGVLTVDPTCISANPQYTDAPNGDYEIASGSPAQQGDPSFVDWDDTGSPSGNPANTDPNTRSRMGCTGGPDGEFVGLLPS